MAVLGGSMPLITALGVGYGGGKARRRIPKGLRYGAGALIAFKGEVALWRK